MSLDISELSKSDILPTLPVSYSVCNKIDLEISDVGFVSPSAESELSSVKL